MKDIVIPANRIRKELFMLLYCYIAANLVNVASIIIYKTEWMELITWQRFILFIGILFYLVTAIVRGVYYLLKSKGANRAKKNNLQVGIHHQS